eukprot:2100769-Amphidinium_carterae.2
METSSDASSSTRSSQDTPKLWERTRREEPDMSGVGAGILCQNGYDRLSEKHTGQNNQASTSQLSAVAPGPKDLSTERDTPSSKEAQSSSEPWAYSTIDCFRSRAASARRDAPGVPRVGKTAPLPQGERELHSHSPRDPSSEGKSFSSFAWNGRAIRLSA